MKIPFLKALFATTLVLGFSLSAHAELVSEEVNDDAITPEKQEVVIVPRKAAKLPVAYKKVYVQEPAENSAMENVSVSTNNNQAIAIAAAPAPRKGVGSAMDEAVDTKMSDVRNQFEQAIVKSLDRIKVSVDDGGTQSQQTTSVVKDDITETVSAPSTASANAYISIDKAPKVSETNSESDDDLADAVTLGKVAEKKNAYGIRVEPFAGWTVLSTEGYNVDAQYTAGFGIEVDIDENFSGVASYSYSQYKVGLATGNPYYNQYYPGPNSYSLNSLEYNQNVFEAGLRMYLMPKQSKFRVFLGGGLGLNKGYLHAKQASVYGGYPGYAAGAASEEYTVTSFLGTLETGGDIQFSRTVSVGALFKYYKVLSVKDSQQQVGYYGNGYYPGDVTQIGRAIADNDFYSILGTVKVSF